MLVSLGPGAMISDQNCLCYHHYIHVLDPILKVIVTYYVLLVEGPCIATGCIGDFFYTIKAPVFLPFFLPTTKNVSRCDRQMNNYNYTKISRAKNIFIKEYLYNTFRHENYGV